MPTIEERVAVAEATIKKLYEDIAELEARRSKLRNEINTQLKEAKEQSDALHSARMETLDKEYQGKLVKLSERQKYLDDYMVRLDDLKMELSSKEKAAIAKDKVIADADKNFAAEKDRVIKEVDSLKKSADNESVRAKVMIAEAVIKEEANTKKEIRLNSQELGFAVASEKAQKAIAEIDKKKEEAEAILNKNEEKLQAIKDESSIVRDILDDIQEEKTNLVRLSAYKDDIAKFEKEKEVFAEKQKKFAEFSKKVEARDVKVKEDEQSLKEKERYNLIKERGINEKISILKKIRQGESG